MCKAHDRKMSSVDINIQDQCLFYSHPLVILCLGKILTFRKKIGDKGYVAIVDFMNFFSMIVHGLLCILLDSF